MKCHLTQNTSYTTKPTRSSMETLRLGRRRYAIIDIHNPMAKAMKRQVLKHFTVHI